MCKDVYVFAEQRDGNLQKVGIELIGEARKLADDLGQNVVAVLLGNQIKDKASELIAHGADKVVVVDDEMLAEYVTEPYAKAMMEIIQSHNPEIVLYGATSIGRDLAPRVSARIHTGLTADCTKLDIDEETKLLKLQEQYRSGKIREEELSKEQVDMLCALYDKQISQLRKSNAILKNNLIKRKIINYFRNILVSLKTFLKSIINK